MRPLLASSEEGLSYLISGTDIKDLDDEFDDKQKVKTSGVQTQINLLKCFVGAASFELPWAFMQAGWIGALFGTLFLALMSLFAIKLIVRCGKVTSKESPTFPDLGFAAFGKFGYRAIWFGMIAMTLGVCGSYIVFIVNAMSELTNSPRVVWLFVVPPIIIVLSWLPSMKHLSFTSSFGVFALCFALLATIVDCVKYHNVNDLDSYPKLKIGTFPLFLGNTGYLYLIGTAVLPIEQGMQNRSDFNKQLSWSIVVVTVINITFGLFAYFSYGDCSLTDKDDDNYCTQDNVTDNLHPGVIAILVKIFLSVDLLFTCVIYLFAFTHTLERDVWEVNELKNARVKIQTKLMKATCVIAFSIIAYFVPNFGLLTGLSGGFGNNILAFILPPMIYLKLQYDQDYWTNLSKKKTIDLLLCVCALCFGIFFLVTSTMSFLTAIIKD